jgi:hypothetical protein
MTTPNTIIADLVAEIDALRIDAERYRYLRDRLVAADFDWNETGDCVLIFDWPKNVPVGGNCDMNIDAAVASAKGDSPC